MKAVVRGKILVLNAYIKKRERSQMNNLNVHLRKLEKEKQIRSKLSRRQEIIKIRADMWNLRNKWAKGSRERETKQERDSKL